MITMKTVPENIELSRLEMVALTAQLMSTELEKIEDDKAISPAKYLVSTSRFTEEYYHKVIDALLNGFTEEQEKTSYSCPSKGLYVKYMDKSEFTITFLGCDDGMKVFIDDEKRVWPRYTFFYDMELLDAEGIVDWE